MNGADLAILAVIGLSVLIGIVRGFVVEVMSLVSWIASAAAAIYLGPTVGEWFAASVPLPSARLALGYTSVFIVALLLGALAIWLLRKIVKGTGLSGTDRMLGLVFGLARGAVVVVALVLLGGLTPFPRDPWWQDSRTLPAFEEMALRASQWLPGPMRRGIDFSGAPPAPPGAPPDAADKPELEAPGEAAPESTDAQET